MKVRAAPSDSAPAEPEHPEPEGESKPKGRHRRWFRWRYLLVPAVFLALVTFPPLVDGALDLRQARIEFAAGIAAVEQLDVPAAKEHFASGGRHAASAERKLNLAQTLPAKWVPVIGDNLRAVAALAEGAKLLGPAAQQALGAAEIFPSGPDGPSLGFSEGRIDTDRWQQAGRLLSEAAQSTRVAAESVEDAGGLLLPFIARARDQFALQAATAARSLETGSDGSMLIADSFGATGPKTWLLLLQNPVEPRATGGYLGAFGILSADAGRLNLERFDNNNNFPFLAEPAPAPAEFTRNYDRFFSRTSWINTNMSPDFPTVAGVLASMWEQGTDRRIDGVVAIDAVALNELLKLVGPVEAPPVGEINGGNFLQIALNEAYIRFPEKENRSSFLLEVGREVWARLARGQFPGGTALLGPMGEMVERKRVQIWSREEQERVRRLGLSGELAPEEGSDYLLVVSQNAAGNKIDYYARRTIAYRVSVGAEGALQGLVELTIQNDAPAEGLPAYVIGPNVETPDDPPGLNRTYATVFMPGTSVVLAASVDGEEVPMETRSEKGLNSASRYVEVPSKTVSKLSVSTAGKLGAPPGEYRLVLQHQPHLLPDTFQLEIQLPPGSAVESASEGMSVEGSTVRWSGALDSDLEFLVRYDPSEARL